MDRVERVADQWMAWWNDQYARVNDTGIVRWSVQEAMRSLEEAIESGGRGPTFNPRGLRERTGERDWTRDELILLYRSLSTSASFFEYTPRTYRTTDGPP